MSKSVGLEIHARGVRAVELRGRGRKFRVVKYMERPLTPRGGAPDPAELEAALADIFKAGRFSRNHVVASVEAHETIVREIPVPFKADDQIRKVVKYEAEHHLHDCDADDVIVQYTKVGESKEGTNLLVFAVRKADIGRRIEYARSAGVEPLAIDLDALAFYYAARAAGLLEQTPNCVLLNIAHRSTEMVFVADGEVKAVRSDRMGVDSIAHGLARDMDIELVEADTKLHGMAGDGKELDLLVPAEDAAGGRRETEKSHAELERDLFAQKRDEFVARLKREFVRSSAALRSLGEPERIVASGPGLAVPGLLEHLGKRLGVAVEAFQPSRAFPCKLNGTSEAAFDAGAGVALGLAIKGLGEDPLDIDFRQEELTVANRFELLKGTLAVSVTLVFLALMAASFFFVKKARSLENERYAAILTDAYKPFKDVALKYNSLGEAFVPAREQVNPGYVESDQAGPRHQAISRMVSTLRRMSRSLQSQVGDKELPQITSALKVWNDIFTVISGMHAQIGYIDFELVEVEQEKVTLNMIVPSAAVVDKLKVPLSEIGFLKDMELEPLSVTPVRNTDFQRVSFRWRERRK
jgi:type IV pilus assembly protein PilM